MFAACRKSRLSASCASLTDIWGVRVPSHNGALTCFNRACTSSCKADDQDSVIAYMCMAWSYESGTHSVL